MKNLKKVRTEHNISQQEIAKKLNISQATYWGYEIGKYEPNIDLLLKMSEIFNVSIDYLLGNENINTIDLSGMPEIKKEVLLYYVNKDEFDILQEYRAIKKQQEWEEENPEEAFKEKQRAREEEQRQMELWQLKLKKLEEKERKNKK